MSATKKQKVDDGANPTQHNAEDEAYNNEAATMAKFSLGSDVDDMVGDMLKEELQLVVTRLLRDDPNLDVQIKKQILKVMNSRNRNTPPSATALKQLEQFAATFRQSQLLLGAASLQQRQQQVLGDGMTQQMSMDPTQMMGHGALMDTSNLTQNLPFGSSPLLGGSALQDLSSTFGGVNIAAIRRKIRDAFVSQNGLASIKRGRFGAPMGDIRMTYRIDPTLVRAEKEKAKDKILNKGEIRDGLNIMEAITSEYVTRGNELGVNSIDGYEEMLQEVAKEWVEIFLFENLDIEQEERVEWAKKLFDWDTSANEEEGTFSTARYAAKLAWNNAHLKNVLKGESIGKFSEPKALSVERLNQLERDGRFEEGMNLAKAVDLDFYLARFLLKIDRVQEAHDVAQKLEDVSQLFSIAQMTRALDVDVAFDLALKSVALSKEWNSETSDRARWLSDLAISNKKTDLLVEKCTLVVVHKTVQFRIAQILKEKEQYDAALSLAKVALKPVPLPELKLHEPAASSPAPASSFSAPTIPINVQVAPVIEESTIVPSDLPRWIWDLAHEMLVLDFIQESGMYAVLDYIIEHVNNVSTLFALLQVMNNKREYDQVIALGTKIFQKINSQQTMEYELQKDLIRQIVDEPEVGLALLRTNVFNVPLFPQDLTPNVIYNALVKHNLFRELVASGAQNIAAANPQVQIQLVYNATWDNLRMQTVSQMVSGALSSRIDQLQMNSVPVLGLRPVKPMSRAKLSSVVRECTEELNNVDQLFNLSNTLASRQEYTLAIEVLDKAQRKITEQRQEKRKRTAAREQLLELQTEAQELANNRKTLKLEQLNRMKELEYQTRVFALDAPSADYEVAQHDNYHLSLASSAIVYALEAKVVLATDQERVISGDEADQVINRHLNYVSNPSGLKQIMQAIQQRNEYELLNKIGFKTLDIIQEMIKAKKVREETYVPIQIIQAEQEELLEKRQQLPAIRQQQLRKLEQEYEALPNPEHFDLDNFDQYESAKYDIGLVMVRTCLNSKVKQPTNIGFGGFLQAAVIQKEPLSDERIQFITMEVLNYVESPTNMFEYARECSTRREYELMMQIGDKALEANKEMAIQRESSELPKLQYDQLRAEKEKLMEQKKFLKPEQIKMLADMEVEQKIKDDVIPRFAKKSLDQYDNDSLAIIKLMLTTLLSQKENLKYKLKDLMQSELTRGDDAMHDDVDPKIEVIADIATTEKQLSRIVERSVEYVQNPNHTLALANALSDSEEFDIVLELGKVIQSRIPVLLSEKKERDIISEELDEILQEEKDLQDYRKQMKNKRKKLDGDKVAKLGELQIQVSMFRILPSYKNSSAELLDTLHLNTAILLIQSMIKSKNNEEKEMELQFDLAEADKQEAREKHDTKIEQVVDQCMPFVQNPKHILTIIDKIKGSNVSLTFKFGRYAIEQSTYCEVKKRERAAPEQLIQIIRGEESDLELLRKQLPDDVQKQLDDAQENLNNMLVEYYVIAYDYNDFNNWKNQAITKMLGSVLSTKADFENRIAFDHSLTVEQIENETTSITNNLKIVIDLLCDERLGVKNPNNLQAIAFTLQEKSEYKQSIFVGENCLAILEQLKKEEEERKLPEQHYALLVQEKQKALQQRNQIPVEQQNELRRLALKHNLLSLEPAFTKQSQDKYDTVSFAVSRIMISSALDLKKLVDEKADADSQAVESEYEDESTEASKFLVSIVDKCITKVSSVENLIRILQDMSAKYEYALVLRIGAFIQKNILVLKEQVARIKELEEEQQKLLQQSKIQRTVETEKRLGEIQAELSNLPLKYKGFYTLDNFTLTVSKLMMDAAKVEEDNEILLEQSVITFKITMTSDAFVEVKVLSAEEEWQKTRIRLLDYVMAHIYDDRDITDKNILTPDAEVCEEDDASEDEYQDSDSDRPKKRKAPKRKTPKKRAKSSPSVSTSSLSVHRRATMKEKLQLLLDEGMWSNVVSIFPDPTHGGTIELLERIYIEIKKHTSGKIDGKILQLVEQYVTREFQLFELENSKSLLDMVEKDNVTFIEGMFERISENLLQTLVQRQYASFVDFLKVAHERLLKYGESGDDDESEEEESEEDTKRKKRAPKKKTKAKKLSPWEKFFTNLTTKHKTKKKLMSLINMQSEFAQ